MKYLILNEKSSAMQNFAKALGGVTGHFKNFDYQLTHAHGHLLGLAMPEHQSSDVNFQDRVKHWSDTTTIPWKLNTFKWKKTYLKDKRTGTTKKLVDHIKSQAQGCDAIVIATDDDPSGEGDVLGQEIVKAIHWNKKVYRCRFSDESPEGIKEGLSHLEDVTDASKSGKYVKGLARERFDYATMQASRLATQDAREQSYDVVVRPGRLKSVIVSIVYNQQRARDSFVPKDQFQAIFKDENGTKFINREMNKYDTRDLAENDMTHLAPSTITVDTTKRRHKKAPQLLNFAQVGIVLGHRASLKNIIHTYQLMYQAGYVSYPRTEDRAMTEEQWNQLLNIADAIASVVGVDLKLLVHKEPRKPYVTKKQLAHGANRPGLTVPKSLDQMKEKFGPLGAAIYETLAKSYLAALGPDYQYDATTAFVTDYPKFTAHQNVPVDPGYKQILGSIETSTHGKSKKSQDTKFGQKATPAVNKTKTVPPKKPTKDFVLKFLTKHNVGTGATQVQTLSALMNGKNAVLADKKGQLVLTPAGVLSGAVINHTLLASPKITKQLSEMTTQVGQFKIPMENIYKAVNVILAKDRTLMEQNAKHLDSDSYLKGKLPEKSANSAAKWHGKYKDGKEVSFKKVFMGHHFTPEERDALLAGNTIRIQVTTKKGIKMSVTGKLEQMYYKKFKYWGFKPNWDSKK